ncbi:hypothetical protein TrRE_jg7779 [Triparma retinervis]|uniref:Uncharacterized protein n=1 Tax=Triparma retinervis TaxID=2557542 RepID=A0A9W7L679_9STRA|nr:hypothetical protein TrRE_jg7779 [Triparma retinervis]
MMTPLRPTLTSTVRTRCKPSTIWGVYESLKWESFNATVTSVKPNTSGSNTSGSTKLSIGMPIDISTSKPSFSGSTFLESCFKDQQSNGAITYTLNLNPLASMTQTYKIETIKGGETEVTHGVRYDGMLKKMYEGSVAESELRESVENIIRQAEELEKANLGTSS